ncbi:hypothetical protein GGX14DRAFT_558396 [Mycena pura]|uniref:Ubiquitin-like protease family profile domain-containing protein n=1 Tax=Mycena pura TaxID=153505 RepID=A0AAD6YKR9_9AGAR|nr:hypothetical protein GGX14DRAFT_558396 [Mycena pura]
MVCPGAPHFLSWQQPIGFAKHPPYKLTYEHLADDLGENLLSDSVVDALLEEVKSRLPAAASKEIVVADTFFSACITDGAAGNKESFGYPVVQKYTAQLTNGSSCTLLFPYYSPPFHWAAGRLELQAPRIQCGDSIGWPHPKRLIGEMETWLTRDVGLIGITVSDDLPCAKQDDAVNCGIISANTIAHHALGDPLWDKANARTNRYQAFCTIAQIILQLQEINELSAPPPFAVIGAKSSVESPSEDVEMQDTTQYSSNPDILGIASNPLTDDDVSSLIAEHDTSNAPAVPLSMKRPQEEEDHESDDGAPAKKRPKKSAAAAHAASAAKTSKANGSKKPSNRDATRKEPEGTPMPKPKTTLPHWVQLDLVDTLRTGGQSKTARHDRVVSILIKYGLYVGNAKRLQTLQEECRKEGGDPDPGLDIRNPKQVVCSRCKRPIQLQAAYQAGRFRDHWKKQTCKKAPITNNTITSFFGASVKSKAPKPPPAPLVKHCPGLTGTLNSRIDYDIENCPVTGAGSRDINSYVRELYEEMRGIKSIRDPRLKTSERAKAYHQQALDRHWRIETSPHRSSVVSTQCLIKFTVQSKAQLEDLTLVCSACLSMSRLRTSGAPHIYANPIQARIMATYHGLEEFLNEKSELGFLVRFVHGVIAGHFKDHKIFLGLVETMVLAKDRQLRGVGMQNFPYPPDFREWGAWIRMSSPRTYRNMAQQFRMESECSIKHRQSQRPRFPIGITAESFTALQQYCKDYDYPIGYPLCVSVDDTKAFPAMQPLYDGPEKTWFLVGLPGETQLSVTSTTELEKLMDQKHTPATKLRLFVVQIPFPGIVRATPRPESTQES